MRPADDLIRQIAATTGPEGRLLLGMGQTGLSMARWLQAQGLAFRAIDSRALPPELTAVQALVGNGDALAGAWPSAWFDAAEILFVSPGVPLADPLVAAARERGVRVISDIELFVHASDRPLVAVTGSNGKSTVVTLLTMAAQAAGVNAASGGNIGTPALDLLGEPYDLAVLELSSFQLEMIPRLNATVAMLLNLSPDHQDRYASMDDYRAAKQRIFRGCEVAAIQVDDAETWPGTETGCRVVRYGSAAAPDTLSLQATAERTVVRSGKTPLWQGKGLKLKGRHNERNVLAVFATALALGWNLDAVGRAVSAFRGLPHRCEWVAECAGVTFINDSKGTNVGATLAAVQGLLAECTGTFRLLLGGDAKGASFSDLATTLRAAGIRPYCFGRDAAAIASALQTAGMAVNRVDTLAEALALAWADAQPNDWVVLSPACASLDQFSDYAARGRAFVQAVTALADDRPVPRQGGMQ